MKTEDSKPYFRCAIHPELRFNRHTIDRNIHVYEWHAVELQKRAPNIERKHQEIIDSFFEESDV